jgi:RNA polymerase II elongation factor ELL
MAIKRSLTHLLAVQPETLETCVRLIREPYINVIVDRIAKKIGNEYHLYDRSYKDLDVWVFPYKSQSDRDAAIDNAVKAYDRLRIAKEDDLWQKLLPEEERGQGKVLSRLQLKRVEMTPHLKAMMALDRKLNGPPKKTEQKKAENESARAKKSKDSTEEESIKVAKAKTDNNTPKLASNPKPNITKVKRTVKKETPAVKKESKPSTAAKSLLNKPKNPSPLSASPPVNATDFEDDHPIHKAMSAAVSPKRASTQRRPEDRKGEFQRSNGVKRKAMDLETDHSKTSTPTKVRKINGNTNGLTNGHRSPQSDNSSGSPPLALSWRQSLELAKKFRTYYDRYAKLYTELSNSVEPPSQAKRDQLLNMHRKLEEMKKEVRSGAL